MVIIVILITINNKVRLEINKILTNPFSVNLNNN